jgi:hypothetical protein
MSVDHCLGKPEGCSPGEIVQACAGLRVRPGGDHVCVDRWLSRPEGLGPASLGGLVQWRLLGPRGGSLGEHGLGGAEERAQGLGIPQPAEQQLRRPMGLGLAYSVSCSFSIWCHMVSWRSLP